MTTTGSWTGWKSNDANRSAYMIGNHTALDIGSAEGKLVDYIDASSAERVTIQMNTGADTAATIKFYTTEMDTPTASFTSAEWDQEPDSSTTYTLGSNSRLKKSLVGPARWIAVTASHAGGVTTVGSTTVFVHLLA